MTISATPSARAILAPVVQRAVATTRIFTVRVADETFGIPVAAVHTVFMIDRLSPVPLAPVAVMGLVNLRGRIVTALSLRRRLGLAELNVSTRVAIVMEYEGEMLALVVDEAGDVIDLDAHDQIELPRHMTASRAAVTQAVYRYARGLLSILDMTAIYALTPAISQS
ncbi:MAG: chemotaxis protein CheW [Hyphomicrobiales bacterium]|nr:chemotaxis protein CheW [Hyphomicrobiales bacterium]